MNEEMFQDFSDIVRFFRESPPGSAGQPEFDNEFLLCLARAMRAERASIFRLNDDGAHLRLERGMGVDETMVREIAIRVGEGICGATAMTRKPISVFDAATTPQHDERIGRATGYHVSSLIAAPIEWNGRLLGVIEALGHNSGKGFPAEWKEMLCSVGALYGAALTQSERANPIPPRPAAPPLSLPKASPSQATVIVGASRPVLAALETCLKAARVDDPVLIRGESGTGKELAARRIHEASLRRGGPLVPVNCAALTDTLLESELFGHVKGAYTGAEHDRRGRFQAAAGGTLFLDEIGEMSISCQAKILRALDSGEITPVGSETPIRVDVRVLAATNRDLWAETQAGRFREDLYFRLCGIEIVFPPLRERLDDIPILAAHFLHEAREERPAELQASFPKRISPKAMDVLEAYGWPGNIRELRQMVRSALALCEKEEIEPEDLPARLWRNPAPSAGAKPADSAFLPLLPNEPPPEAEARRYRKVLRETAFAGTERWNLAAAARALNMPRKTFAYRIKKLGLENPSMWQGR
ncbi:MAG: Transcriptional regulatory protein ZraR [candidate division BRC1 bacterium ADurb.BinA364]|nr:MAG: Transcriptional regulatory protein ZraR [candidate division BRC1 bacterium ADurb.BinA364]